MDPYVDNIVTFRVLLGGYEQAVERFVRASKTRDPMQVFSPLFEALNWAVALDDQARAHCRKARHWGGRGESACQAARL